MINKIERKTLKFNNTDNNFSVKNVIIILVVSTINMLFSLLNYLKNFNNRQTK